MLLAKDNNIKVSAIVSVYNSGRFIKGALEDLLNQSLYKKGNLEIIVVDTASEDNEAEIVNTYCQTYDHIHYIRTEQRETVYGAWNRGIQSSKGIYITNANSDDRHHPEALEKMAQVLDSMPNIVLVYADVYITETPNETFESSAKSQRYYWYDWSRKTLLDKGCFIGPQPMWRRSIHEEYGLFDDSFVVSGDAEFWLRISQTKDFFHIKEPLGLYLKSPEGIEHSNKTRRDFENLKIITLYREAYKKGQIIRVKPKEKIMDTHKNQVSVILIASNNEQYEAMQDMIKAYTSGSVEVLITPNTKGSDGFISSINKTISRCKGEYITIIEDNIVITDNTINNMIDHLGDVNKIVCPVTNFKIFPHKEPYGNLDELRSFAHNYRERNLHRSLLQRNLLSSCITFPQKLLSITGPLDENYTTLRGAIEDLCMRSILMRCPIGLAGDVYVHCSYPPEINPQDRELFAKKWGSIDVSSPEGKLLLSIEAQEEANRLFQQGSMDRAVKTLFDYINILPEDTELQSTLLRILLWGGRFEDVIKIEPMLKISNDKTTVLKCKALTSSGRFDEAERLINLISSDYPEKMNILGIIAMHRGNHKEAEDFFSRSIELDPALGEPYRNLGLLQYSMGKKTQGFKNLERGFILEPFNPRCAESYHLVVSTENLFSRAEKTYQEAIQIFPECRQPLLFLIDSLIKQGKYDYALIEIQRLIVRFGYDEPTLEAAIKLRDTVGPLDNTHRENSISLCMIVKDEEGNLPHCLSSVMQVIDELIVVDTGSQDRSKQICYIFGAKVFYYPWDNNFAAARNHSISKAKGKWILILDADEVISSFDHKIIREIVSGPQKAYQVITRNYTFQNSTLGFINNDGHYQEERGLGWTPSLKIRLFPNSKLLSFQGQVHEMIEESAKRAGFLIDTAPFVIHHYGKLDIIKDRIKGEGYYKLGKEKLNASPEDTKAIKELAIISGGLGKIEEAVALWHRFLEKEPNNIEGMLNLSGLLIAKGDLSEAKYLSMKVLALEPDNKTALANLSFVNNHTKTKQ